MRIDPGEGRQRGADPRSERWDGHECVYRPWEATNGATLLLRDGTFVNDGLIETSGGTLGLTGTVTLDDAGSVSLSGIDAIAGVAGAATLQNNGNTIAGSGAIDVALVNAGSSIVDANVAMATLVLDPQGGTDTNQTTGFWEATSGGTLLLQDGSFTNSGTLEATSSSTVTVAASAQLTNNSGGTLTGGSFMSLYGATMTLSGGPERRSPGCSSREGRRTMTAVPAAENLLVAVVPRPTLP